MVISKLLTRLKNQSYNYVFCSDKDAVINGIKMLIKNQREFKPDILYFGSAELLPKSFDNSSFLNILIYEKDKLDNKREFSNCNIAALSDKVDPYLSYNLLQDYFIESEEQTAKIRRMLSALLSNKGLQYLIDTASQTLGNPIFVIDTSFKYIAKHTGKLPSDDSEYSKHMQQEMEFSSILEDGVEHIKENELDEIVSQMDKPYKHYNSYLKKSTLISSVRIHNIEVAHLMMVEQDNPIDDVSYECFLRLSHFVAQEMQKDSFYLKNKGLMFSYFLIDLLNDPQPSSHIIERRVKTLHYQLLGKYCMTSITARQNKSLTGQNADLLASQLQSILTGNIYAFYESSFVILFNRRPDEPSDNFTREQLKRCASVNNLNVGISNAFYDLTDIKRFYHQAVTAASLGERYPKPHAKNPIYYYRDYSYIEMLNICREKANLMDFCHPSLIRLLEYDQKSKSNMMSTLYEYLEHSANTQKTANALYIHKNTLLYRIERIRSITSNDLTSGEDLFLFHLSFRVLIFLGLFTPNRLPEKDDTGKD